MIRRTHSSLLKVMQWQTRTFEQIFQGVNIILITINQDGQQNPFYTN